MHKMMKATVAVPLPLAGRSTSAAGGAFSESSEQNECMSWIIDSPFGW